MKKLWFKNKTYGWGWTPASWEGWLVIAVYVAVLAYSFSTMDQNSHSGSDTLLGFFPIGVVATIVLLIITVATGEKPEWRWGKKK